MLGLLKKEAAPVPAPVMADFEYIDSHIAKALDKPLEHTEEERSKAKEAGKRIVAGFRVHDPKEEEAALDRFMKKREDSRKKFFADKDILVTRLKERGVGPLAVVPSKAWIKICREAGLILLDPQMDGTVYISRDAVKSYKNASEIYYKSSTDYAGYIRSLFPDKPTSSRMSASLVLPNPPQDVAETLLKVKDLDLDVAAVPEAISFKETPQQLWNNQKAIEDKEAEDRRRMEEWIRLDPIVFHVNGSATGVIAQFGDFPIEKKVVDAVIAADDFLDDAVTGARHTDVTSDYLRLMEQVNQQQALLYRQGFPVGLLGIAQSPMGSGGLATITNQGIGLMAANILNR